MLARAPHMFVFRGASLWKSRGPRKSPGASRRQCGSIEWARSYKGLDTFLQERAPVKRDRDMPAVSNAFSPWKRLTRYRISTGFLADGVRGPE